MMMESKTIPQNGVLSSLDENVDKTTPVAAEVSKIPCSAVSSVSATTNDTVEQLPTNTIKVSNSEIVQPSVGMVVRPESIKNLNVNDNCISENLQIFFEITHEDAVTCEKFCKENNIVTIQQLLDTTEEKLDFGNNMQLVERIISKRNADHTSNETTVDSPQEVQASVLKRTIDKVNATLPVSNQATVGTNFALLKQNVVSSVPMSIPMAVSMNPATSGVEQPTYTKPKHLSQGMTPMVQHQHPMYAQSTMHGAVQLPHSSSMPTAKGSPSLKPAFVQPSIQYIRLPNGTIQQAQFQQNPNIAQNQNVQHTFAHQMPPQQHIMQQPVPGQMMGTQISQTAPGQYVQFPMYQKGVVPVQPGQPMPPAHAGQMVPNGMIPNHPMMQPGYFPVPVDPNYGAVVVGPNGQYHPVVQQPYPMQQMLVSQHQYGMPQANNMGTNEPALKRQKYSDNDDEDSDTVPKSRFRGVRWYKRTGKWVVQVRINKKRKHIGYFKVEEEAAKAYAAAMKKASAIENGLMTEDELTADTNQT